MRRLDEGGVHGRRHEGFLLVAHILEKPHGIGQTLFGEEDFEVLLGQVGVGLDHIGHPVGVECHAQKHVLVAAHGNSLRSLVMVLDRMTTETITSLNLATGVPLIYKLNADTTVASKEIVELDT